MMFDDTKMAVRAVQRGAQAHARAGVSGKIEYRIMRIAALAKRLGIPENAAFSYMRKYGAFAPCVKHYGYVMKENGVRYA